MSASKRRPKRNTYELIHDILVVVDRHNGDAKKTYVMYEASLSYELTDRYINALEKLGLVEKVDGMYRITEKGKQVLAELKAYKELKAKYQEVLNRLNAVLPLDKVDMAKEEEEKPAVQTGQPQPAVAQVQTTTTQPQVGQSSP